METNHSYNKQFTRYLISNTLRMIKFRLIFTFYRSFILFSLLINFACVSILHHWGLGTFTSLFWFKISTLIITYFLVNDLKSNEFSYYKNLGLSKGRLWTSTLIFDFCFFSLAIILTMNIW